MSLQALPLEIFQVILSQAIIARRIKHGLRLRLVSKLFATEVIRALYTSNLLDDHFTSYDAQYLIADYDAPPYAPAVSAPPFTASYLEHRVLNELANGGPMLLCIRKIAKVLCQESTSDEPEEQKARMHIKLLCSLAAERIRPDGTISTRIFHQSTVEEVDREFSTHLFVAAVSSNSIPIVKRLIDQGHLYPWMEVSHLFGSPSTCAGSKGSNEMLELLTSNQHYAGYVRRTLRAAARAGRIEVVRFLFNLVVQKATRDMDEAERLEKNLAALTGNPLTTPSKDVFSYLMEQRHKLSVKTRLGQTQYAIYLRRCAIQGWTEMAQHLLHLGAYANGHPFDTMSWTDERPILHACSGGFLDIVQMLLDHGAETKGAMAVAAGHGYREIVQTLLDHGAEHRGALAKAAAGGFNDIVQILLDHGADANEGSPSPIVSAVELEHTPMFYLLLGRGANFLDPETSGECVRRAKAAGLESMLLLLKEHGVDLDN